MNKVTVVTQDTPFIAPIFTKLTTVDVIKWRSTSNFTDIGQRIWKVRVGAYLRPVSPTITTFMLAQHLVKSSTSNFMKTRKRFVTAHARSQMDRRGHHMRLCVCVCVCVCVCT